MKRELSFVLNGEQVSVEVEAQWSLLYLLREVLELKGTKEGCGYGECGTCTVVIDGKSVNSCLFPVMEAEGRSVTTIEGLQAQDGGLHPLHKGLYRPRSGAVRLLFPGHDHVCLRLIAGEGDPRDDEIKDGIEGNLCRCTGYVRILEAIRSAAKGR